MEPTIIGLIGCGTMSDAYLLGAARSKLARVKSVADIRLHAAQAKRANTECKPSQWIPFSATPDIEIVVNLTIPPHAGQPANPRRRQARLYRKTPRHPLRRGKASHRICHRPPHRLRPRHLPQRRPSGLPLRHRRRPDRLCPGRDVTSRRIPSPGSTPAPSRWPD
jgi:hypothetical protein